MGAQGRLGRELTYQALCRGLAVDAIVRRPLDPVLHPTRRGWLTPDTSSDDPLPIVSEHLALVPYDEWSCRPDTSALLIAVSGSPFAPRREMDAQTDAVARVCALASDAPGCRSVCLVSAHGAGDSLSGANLGIQVMHNVYLRETYRAKEAQETIVRGCARFERTLVLRPKALSVGRIPLNTIATPRYELATQILDWMDEPAS